MPKRIKSEKTKAYDKQYKKDHREETNSLHADWKKRNPDKIAAWNLADRLAHPEKYHWKASRLRAKKLGLEFSIEVSDIVIPKVCPVYQIPLFSNGGPRTDNSPSVDRIDNTKGYVKGNVWVISWKANDAKGRFSLAELKTLVQVLEQVMPIESSARNQ